MSDKMTPIPFEALLDWALGEWRTEKSIFGISRFYQPPEGAGQRYMGRFPETAVGPAAGPHTQLAQNIAAAYLCGARIFELKTVQIIDGEDLVVSKPCILAEDEGYNCEWSTELTVPEARDEYIKAWFLLHVLAKELGLGRSDGFVFNMSVGYDLKGIQSPKIDGFINDMKDASDTAQFEVCRAALSARLDRFQHFDAGDLSAVSPQICNSMTVSTMHGCPAGEIENIALHLMENKGLNLLLKCNPTLVGYDEARATLDGLGFGYIHFDRASFDNDLQYADAVPMLKRLQNRAGELGLYFGVKLTNTFAVKSEGALPDENMYMSGRALLPLSLRVAAMLGRDFGGTLPISYCGGANRKNIAALRQAGLYPITVCTELLKPGGYGALIPMAQALEGLKACHEKPDGAVLDELSKSFATRAGESRQVRRAPRPEKPEARARCWVVCGMCAMVCPNRANAIVTINGRKQMLHLDALCNECGNCASFCRDKCAPYLEKLTIFADAEALNHSLNDGFAPLDDAGRFLIRWRGARFEAAPEDAGVPEALRDVLNALREHYPWLLN